MDSGGILYRNFCDDCGYPIIFTTPLFESILGLKSGTLDEAGEWWRPNKGLFVLLSLCAVYRVLADVWIEQYIETKSHWLPGFEVHKKEGVEERHPRAIDLSGSKGTPT